MGQSVELSVSKESLYSLFKDKYFIIPEYQRPYTWDEDLCSTLWSDLTDYEQSTDSEYFLGTVVYYYNDDKQFVIIDGQQRITTFKLLFRAIYEKSEGGSKGAALELKNKLRDCLWKVERKGEDNVPVITEPKLSSLVSTENENEQFIEIMEKGSKAYEGRKPRNKFEKNYNFFLNACREYNDGRAGSWIDFVDDTLLSKCIILPIRCNSEDSAITIFSTINDRGMQLADSDIIKSYIYKSITDDSKKKEFTDAWKGIAEESERTAKLIKQMKIDGILRNYMYYLRGKESDKKKEEKLRAYYTNDIANSKHIESAHKKEYEYRHNILYDNIDDIKDLSKFWSEVAGEIDTPEPQSKPEYIIWLHCLNQYPNDYWKYLTSVFYLTKRNERDFLIKRNEEYFLTKEFPEFLKKLVSICIVHFVEQPNVNHIKTFIFNSCVNVANGKQIEFSEKPLFADNWDNNKISSKLDRMLVLLDAYLTPNNNNILVHNKFEVEHIFPKKWQTNCYLDMDRNAEHDFIELLGNKVALDKKTNIKVSNKYFGEKRKYYRESVENKRFNNKRIKELSDTNKEDWGKDDVGKRDERFKNTILNFIIKNLNKV